MNPRTHGLTGPAGTLLVSVCLAAAVLVMSPPAAAVKRGAESVNCGGAASQSTSYRANDTIAQSPIGPVGVGNDLRIYDGFWLILPGINVPVEGAVYVALTDAGTPLVRWTVGSLADLIGFNVYRATEEEGPFELLNDTPLNPQSPGSFEDTTTWPETTFWYEVRAVLEGGIEDIVNGSPAEVTTGGKLALRLYPLVPNPSPGLTTLRFDVPDHIGPARLIIYNIRGQRVRTILDGPAVRGRYERTWAGTDDMGRHVASGVYFARLEIDGKSDIRKVIVLR